MFLCFWVKKIVPVDTALDTITLRRPLGGQRKIAVFHFFAGVQFVLQLCHGFYSCAFFADVLKLCIIPTYIFADLQMK
jgi:hypothetical protein